jgi:hypothetical protein
MTPFEKNYGVKLVFYNKRLDWGLFLKLNPIRWFQIFWGHPEADVIWYDVGPVSFFTCGRA